MKVKALAAMIAGAAVLFASCKKEEIYTIQITPETASVFTDEALPELSVTSDPASALAGKTIEYTSSMPEVISVSEDGKLKFEVKDLYGNISVTITAKVGNETATCVIEALAQIGHYEVLDIKGTSLKILDRNVGAKSTSEIGNYYQWGKNTPVAANDETATNSNYDPDWSATSAGIIDWTEPENTPCPFGWRIPNADDMKTLADATEDIAYWWMDFIDRDEAQAAFDTLESMGLIPTGKFQKGKDGKYLPNASYFWSTYKDASGTLGMFENNNFPNFGKKNTYDMAVPVRCVR